MLKYVVLLVILVIAAIGIIAVLMSAKRRRDYVRRPLLSPAELSFFKVLEQALGGKYRIFTKIRLADIIKVSGEVEKRERQTAFNRIQSKHVDFVLCDPDDLAVYCVIELDDRSHNAGDRIARDEFVDSALGSAEIPIARFAARRQYSTEEIAKALDELGKKQQTEKVDSMEAPVCSLCGAPMVLRTANKGEHAGKPFYGCSTFPKCKNTAQYLSLRDTKLMKSMLK